MILASTFSAAVAALPVMAQRNKERPLGCDTPFEWARLALATYAASRIIAREKVGSFIREPLMEAAEHHEERVLRGTGESSVDDIDDPAVVEAAESWSGALAELVTCTRCAGVWSATGLTFLRAFAPAHGRVVLDVLSAAGANNFLQAAFTRLAAQANMDEKREEIIDLVSDDPTAARMAVSEAHAELRKPHVSAALHPSE